MKFTLFVLSMFTSGLVTLGLSQTPGRISSFQSLHVGMPKDSALQFFSGKYLLIRMPTPFAPHDTTFLVSDQGKSGEVIGMVRCDSTSVVTIAENIGQDYKSSSTVACMSNLCDILSTYANHSENGDRKLRVEMTLRDLKGSNLTDSQRLTININDSTLVNLDVLIPLESSQNPARVTLMFVRHKQDPKSLHER